MFLGCHQPLLGFVGDEIGSDQSVPSGRRQIPGERINAVTCVLAAIDLARSLPWFAAAVRDIRMLRIEELNDLMPAVQQANPE